MKLRQNLRSLSGIAAAMLIAIVGLAPPKAAAADSKLVEPNALRLLNSAAAYLKSQPSLAFRAAIRYDDVQPSGLKYQINALATYKVRRPGQLFVDYSGDRRNVNFWSDGKTFVMYDRRANVYATAPASDDNDATLATLFSKFDFTVPLDDIISNDPVSALAGKLQSGYDLGPSAIAGDRTRHLLFTQSDIDWQIWIDEGQTPLIRQLLITYKKLPGQPQYAATFSDWNFSPNDGQAFVFTPPKGALHVDFVAAFAGAK